MAVRKAGGSTGYRLSDCTLKKLSRICSGSFVRGHIRRALRPIPTTDARDSLLLWLSCTNRNWHASDS